jgi:anti-sigma regulatory factor (Ser/Thr protein kinase)
MKKTRAFRQDDQPFLGGDAGNLYRPLERAYRNHIVPCDPHELTGVRRFIELFCQDFCSDNISEQSLYHLELAVHEVVANIIRHAYPPDAPGNIHLEAVALENEVRVQIVDHGIPYPHPEDMPLPTFDGTRDHGFGLFLVGEGTDKQERFRDEMGRNVLTLTKRYDRKAVGVRS